MRVPQMFLAALPLLLLAAPACKKKEDNTAPAASAPSADVLGKVDVPNDDTPLSWKEYQTRLASGKMKAIPAHD